MWRIPQVSIHLQKCSEHILGGLILGFLLLSTRINHPSTSESRLLDSTWWLPTCLSSHTWGWFPIDLRIFLGGATTHQAHLCGVETSEGVDATAAWLSRVDWSSVLMNSYEPRGWSNTWVADHHRRELKMVDLWQWSTKKISRAT